MRTVRIAFAVACCMLLAWTARAQQAPSDLDPHQIQWQRSLDDALSIATTEKRPILIAINVDGESASDRIVDEVYRDPKFVAWTRNFACVAASISRHNPRDHDDHGRRILCPRLGNVTCGEHIALEPILYDKYLGGERISPRHALIASDGKKVFDLTLQWDWSELENKVEEQSKAAPAPVTLPLLPHSAKELSLDFQRKGQPKIQPQRPGQWRSLASAHTAFGRDAFEATVAGLPTETLCDEALDALSEVGDAGSVEVLRIMLARTPAPSTALIERVGNAAAAVHGGPALLAVVRERVHCGRFLGAVGLDEERMLLPLLGRFGAEDPATRSYLLAQWAIGSEVDRRAAGDAIAPHLERDVPSRCAAAIEAEGGGVQLGELLLFSRAVKPVPRAVPPDETKSEAELQTEIEESDRALAANKADAGVQARFGRASMALGLYYQRAGGANPRLFFEDAQTWLGRAAQEHPEDVKLAFDRAKTAYLLGDFAEEEQIARATFGIFPPRDTLSPTAHEIFGEQQVPDGDVRRAATLLDDTDRIEALRWLGDAPARLLPARANGPADVEIAGFVRGARALALVAVSPGSDETDWLSLASFLAAAGMQRESLAAWQAGVERLPASNALRNGLNYALQACGHIDAAPMKADWIASQHSDSGASVWYAGYAWMLAAEDLRRAVKPDAAVAAYGQAYARFDKSAVLEPDYAISAQHLMAMSALGRGFAHVQAGRLGEAANALVEGIATPSVLDQRDGLDRDVPDLVDALIEWKGGHKSVLDPIALAKRVADATKGSPVVVLDVSDSLLREALRADGRIGAVPDAPPGSPVPGEEGDEYMRDSIAVARMALEIAGDGKDADEAKTRLAQSLTVQAERRTVQGDPDAARPLLSEAAGLLGIEAPGNDAGKDAWNKLAVTLRAKLGPARPVFRPGR
jgi:hypothetical protein